MSKSDPADRPLQFDEWIADEFAQSGSFTALVILMRISGLTVAPLRSTFLHVIGDEIDWVQFAGLLSSSGVKWDGVLISTRQADDGGPLDDLDAKAALWVLERQVIEDRSVINESHFFDKWGRRMKVEEVQLQ